MGFRTQWELKMKAWAFIVAQKRNMRIFRVAQISLPSLVDPHICHIRLTYFLCWKGFCWISKHLSAILPKNLSRDIKATVLHPQTCPIFPLLWLTEGYNLLSTLKKDLVRILNWLLLISKLEMGIQVFFNPQTDHAHRL